MPFEQQHQYFKKISKTTKNFKNINLTLSERNQQLEATLKDRFKLNIECNNVFLISENMFNFDCLPNFTLVTKKIIYHIIEYKENDFIVIDSDQESNISVLKISAIILDTNFENALLYGSLIRTWYNYKSLLYESIETEKSFNVISITNILITNPVHLLHTNKKYYLPMFTTFVEKK